MLNLPSEEKPRVLVLSHMYPNPVRSTDGIFVEELTNAMACSCSIQVISPVPAFPGLTWSWKYKGYEEIPPQMKRGNIDVFYPRFFFIPKFLKCTDWFFYFVFVFPLVWNMKKKFDTMVVHWGYPDGLAGYLMARIIGKKVVIYVHGNESLCFYENTIRKMLVKFYLRRTDHIIAVSSDLKVKMVRVYNVDPDKVTVVANGIDPDLFVPVAKDTARQQLSLPPQIKFFLTIARLSREKRLDVLIDAFASLPQTYEDVRLYIIGDGPEKISLQKLVCRRNKQAKIVFLGKMAHEEVPLWLSAADFFCLSSDREGCPVSIIEAFACSCPVIATSVGGVPDLILSPIYGLLVPAGQSQEMTKALSEAIERCWDRETIGAYGRAFTWRKSADNVLASISVMMKD